MAKSSVRERIITMIRDYETNGCVDTTKPEYRNALHAVACRVSLVQLKDLSNANADQLTQMLKAWVNDPKKFPTEWTNDDYKYYRPPNWPLPVWQHKEGNAK